MRAFGNTLSRPACPLQFYLQRSINIMSSTLLGRIADKLAGVQSKADIIRDIKSALPAFDTSDDIRIARAMSRPVNPTHTYAASHTIKRDTITKHNID